MHSFSATILKAGINPYVIVPKEIAAKLAFKKAFIPVRGRINEHEFQQTLVPTVREGYRLYVNGPMLKGAQVQVGDTVSFSLCIDDFPPVVPMPTSFEKALIYSGTMERFKSYSASRQKEILRYLNSLKTEEVLHRNIGKVVTRLKGKPVEGIFNRILKRTK